MKIRTEVVRGQPLETEGRKLIPVVRQTTALWRRATIGSHLAAQGGGFVDLHPMGVVVQEGEEEQFIPIPDTTRRSLWGILAAAVIVPVLLTLAARLGRR